MELVSEMYNMVMKMVNNEEANEAENLVKMKEKIVRWTEIFEKDILNVYTKENVRQDLRLHLMRFYITWRESETAV